MKAIVDKILRQIRQFALPNREEVMLPDIFAEFGEAEH